MRGPRFIVLYDACVLYPSQLRDLLMHLASCDLFQARWTERIHDEWMRNLARKRPDIAPEKIARTRAAMVRALPHAMVEGFEPWKTHSAFPIRTTSMYSRRPLPAGQMSS